MMQERQPTDRRSGDRLMQEQLDTLAFRVGTVEQSLQEAKAVQAKHMEQTARTEANTAELLETFNALKGAWKVLDALGKLGKPLTVVGSIAAAWWWIKDHIPWGK
jgi:hypothetical protein